MKISYIFTKFGEFLPNRIKEKSIETLMQPFKAKNLGLLEFVAYVSYD